MARRLNVVPIILLMALALAAGCGVKGLPKPRTEVAPEQVKDLVVEPTPSGVKITFTVPQVDKPGRAVTDVRLYYGYLPLTGLANCPPCPPKLKKYHEFEIKGQHEALMEGGQFSYIDKHAPMDMEAIYQVVLIDSWGRMSVPSNLARTPVVEPAVAPAGLTAKSGDGFVVLAWDGVKVDPLKLVKAQEIDMLAGYVLFRKAPEGEMQLNTSPLLTPRFRDSSVENGKAYAYQVAQVRRIKKRNVIGVRSEWVQAAPKDKTAPGVPTGLAGASAKDGLYLRFTPSPDQDTAGYLVFRKDKKGGDFKQMTPKPVKENTFIDTDVAPRGVYIYKVQAVDESGNISKFSEEMEIEYIP